MRACDAGGDRWEGILEVATIREEDRLLLIKSMGEKVEWHPVKMMTLRLEGMGESRRRQLASLLLPSDEGSWK